MPRVSEVLIERLRHEGYITVPEAAELTKVGERTIRTWTRGTPEAAQRAGRVFVRVRKVGSLVFVEKASVCAAAGMPVAGGEADAS